MKMFLWATKRFKIDLQSFTCRAEGTKVIELDRTEIFSEVKLWPQIGVAANGAEETEVERRVQKALQAAQKYSLIANSVKSDVIVEPTITVLE